MENETITTEQIELLNILFDERRKVAIKSDEDYQKLGEIFDEDE